MVAKGAVQTVAGHQFIGFGAHCDDYPCNYLTAAAAIGISKTDVDVFIKRLDKVLGKSRAPQHLNSAEAFGVTDVKQETSELVDETTVTKDLQEMKVTDRPVEISCVDTDTL